jgi:hypothetical protein
MNRRKIQPGDRIMVFMSVRDRDLLEEYMIGDPEYAERLRSASTGRGLAGEYTLDDLEDILGCIAAEANHADDKKLRRELNALYDRLYRIQRTFDDGNWNDRAIQQANAADGLRPPLIGKPLGGTR